MLTAMVRAPAVAGTFYPAPAAVLAAEVDALLRDAARVRPATARVPKALVVPHAGYVYSGPIAASAYARVMPARERITRAVIVGPAHRAYVRGLAAPAARALATPLGELPVDLGALAALPPDARVHDDARAHAAEHSVEVQLPFVQRALPAVRAIVPLVVGQAEPAAVGRVLDALWGGPETVVLISSDLSHYHPYDAARARDARTVARVARLDDAAPLEGEEACGAAGINGLLWLAHRRDLSAEVLDVRNSGDTAGPRDQVVGYGAIAFYEPGDDATTPTRSAAGGERA